MSSARVLEFGAATDLGNMVFPDLKSRLEDDLESVATLPDLENLLMAVNPLLKDGRFSEKEQVFFKRLRQRAYDKKRYQKFQPQKTLKPVPEIKKITAEKIMGPIVIINPSPKALLKAFFAPLQT